MPCYPTPQEEISENSLERVNVINADCEIFTIDESNSSLYLSKEVSVDQYREWFYLTIKEISFMNYRDGIESPRNTAESELLEMFNQSLKGPIIINGPSIPTGLIIKEFIDLKTEELFK